MGILYIVLVKLSILSILLLLLLIVLGYTQNNIRVPHQDLGGMCVGWAPTVALPATATVLVCLCFPTTGQ